MTPFVVEALKHVGEGTLKKPIRVLGFKVAPQVHRYGCGPWSLRYCYLKWGISVQPKKLMQLTRMNKGRGTTDIALAAAAQQLGSVFKGLSAHWIAPAKRFIDNELQLDNALVLGIVGNHWVACLEHTPRGYLVFDPTVNSPVIQLIGWKELATLMDVPMRNGDERLFAVSIGPPTNRRGRPRKSCVTKR